MKTLYIATRGENKNSGQWSPVGRLEKTRHGYRFRYTQGAEGLPDFRPFPGMPALRQVYEADELFPLFKNRVLARTRPEFPAYLTWSGFDPDFPPDAMTVLAVTEGRRATDTLEVFAEPAPDEQGRYNTRFFLHRLRWMSPAVLDRVARLLSNEILEWHREPENAFDPDAVAVYSQDEGDHRTKIGYLPRYLARDFSAIQCAGNAKDLTVSVERVNPDAPLQHRLLCRFNAGWPLGFEPNSRQEYQPLLDLASNLAY